MVRKTAGERTETVSDTARRAEVEDERTATRASTGATPAAKRDPDAA